MSTISGQSPLPQNPGSFQQPVEKKEEKDKAENVEQEAEVEQEVETEVEVEENQENEDDDGDGEGGGSQGGSSGGDGEDPGSGGAFQDMDLDLQSIQGAQGTSKLAPLGKVNAENLSTDKVIAYEKAEVSFMTIPPPNGSAADPTLIPPSSYNVATVQNENKVNSWFSSSFLTTLTLNLMEIVKLNKKIKAAEAKMTVTQMDTSMRLAVAIGDLIMAKAEKEIAKHTALIIAACVSIGIAVGAGATSLAGAGLSARGQFKKASAKADESKANVRLTEIEQGKGQVGSKKPMSADDIQLERQSAISTKRQKVKEANTDISRGTYFSSIGQSITGIGNPLDRAMSSGIEIHFIRQIAEKERDMEVLRGCLQIARQALDSASKGFSDAGQAIDAALQLLQKIQDETARAFTISRG